MFERKKGLPRRSKAEAGQMLLIVVLAMIVALTVGLSILSRTITNLRISRQNEESQRAFQAAEAGIQQALESGLTGASGEVQFLNNAKFQSISSNVGGSGQSEFILSGGEIVDQASGIDVWLSDHPDFSNPLQGSSGPQSNITIYWSTENQDCSNTTGANVVPVIEVIMLITTPPYDVRNPSVKKYIYEPCSPERIDGLTPNASVQTIDNVPFKYNATVSVGPSERGLIMKIIPYFNSTRMAVSAGADLPLQGKIIDSTGSSGGTARRVRYFSSNPQIPPEIFPYSIITQ